MRRMALLTAIAVVIGLAAAGARAQPQTPDELAQLIQGNLEDVAVQLRVAPAQAKDELELQQEQIATLRREAPDHPLLPSLERRLAELDDEVAAALEKGSAAVGDDVVVPLRAPAEVRGQLRDVEQLQIRADRELMRGEPDRAEELLKEAEHLIAAVEEEYGDRIPPGYAKLIVAQERLAALREQLERSPDAE